jgi:poly(3-hydroxybutyrate) depolymerase
MNADIRKWVTRVALFVVAFASMAASAATPVPGGKWSWVWTDKAGTGQPMRVYTYRPRTCDSTCPMVITLHGALRKASDLRDDWELLADRYKVLVVTPEFTEERYPGDAYAIGGIGTEQNKEKWVIATVEHLFDEMRDGQKGYALFGYSAGAQVAQRLALLRPGNRATAIVLANAGAYTSPEFRKDKGASAFPASLIGTAATDTDVRNALGKRIVVLLGENDNDPEAIDMGKGDAVKQGGSRLERGENFFKIATTLATELGTKFAWELDEPPGPTSAQAMSKSAADTLFKK